MRLSRLVRPLIEFFAQHEEQMITLTMETGSAQPDALATHAHRTLGNLYWRNLAGESLMK
jgi:hypothetical protein